MKLPKGFAEFRSCGSHVAVNCSKINMITNFEAGVKIYLDFDKPLIVDESYVKVLSIINEAMKGEEE